MLKAFEEMRSKLNLKRESPAAHFREVKAEETWEQETVWGSLLAQEPTSVYKGIS